MYIYKLLVFILITVSTNISALQVDQKFCFSPGTSVEIVIKDIQKLLLPADKIEGKSSDGNCFIASIGASRVELIEKYMKMNYELVKVYSSSPNQASSRNPLCRLYVQRNKLSDIKKRQGKIDMHGTGASESVYRANNKTESMIILTSGRSGKLQYNDSVMDVLCVKRGKVIDLTFSLAGTQGTNVQTSVTLNPGQTLNIADVKKHLDNNNKQVQLLGASGSSETGNINEEVLVRAE